MIRLHRLLGMVDTHHPGGTAGDAGWVGDKASLEILFPSSIALSIAFYNSELWRSCPGVEQNRAAKTEEELGASLAITCIIVGELVSFKAGVHWGLLERKEAEA
jgi:hypothetical protein